MADMAVRVKRDIQSDVTIAAVSGALDLSSTPKVWSTLTKCLSECPAAVVVDLAGATVTHPAALTVFPAVTRHQVENFLPYVPLMCAGLRRDGSYPFWAALGPVPVYASLASALAAAVGARNIAPRQVVPLTPAPTSVTRARRIAADACARWELGRVEDRVRLIVSELVSNAVCHAGDGIRLELSLRGDFLHIRVYDASHEPPRIAQLNRDEPGGRGLRLVDVYSTGWGYQRSASGKVVWATVRHRPIEARRAAG